MATLLGLAVWHQRRRLGAVYLCWTFLIILSTLTTKQHYAVDALGGAAIAVAAYYFAFNRTKRPIPESSASLR